MKMKINYDLETQEVTDEKKDIYGLQTDWMNELDVKEN